MGGRERHPGAAGYRGIKGRFQSTSAGSNSAPQGALFLYPLGPCRGGFARPCCQRIRRGSRASSAPSPALAQGFCSTRPMPPLVVERCVQWAAITSLGIGLSLWITTSSIVSLALDVLCQPPLLSSGIARTRICNRQPGQLTLGINVVSRSDLIGIVERGNAQRQIVRILGAAIAQYRATVRTESSSDVG